MPHRVHVLGAADRVALHQHFSGLSRDDLRMRFGRSPGADWLRLYVEGIDVGRDVVLGVREGAALVGVAHAALFEGAAELGLSVLPTHRRLGIGSALFDRAVLHSRHRGAVELFVHGLSENEAMDRIARKTGLRVRREDLGADAWIELAPPGAPTPGEARAVRPPARVGFATRAPRRPSNGAHGGA